MILAGVTVSDREEVKGSRGELDRGRRVVPEIYPLRALFCISSGGAV